MSLYIDSIDSLVAFVSSLPPIQPHLSPSASSCSSEHDTAALLNELDLFAVLSGSRDPAALLSPSPSTPFSPSSTPELSEASSTTFPPLPDPLREPLREATAPALPPPLPSSPVSPVLPNPAFITNAAYSLDYLSLSPAVTSPPQESPASSSPPRAPRSPCARGRPRKQKRYSSPIASRFCHICSRVPRRNSGSVVCGNMAATGTCRKIVCERCMGEAGWDFAAVARDKTWICCHCAGECPEKSQCYVYGRINARRKKAGHEE